MQIWNASISLFTLVNIKLKSRSPPDFYQNAFFLPEYIHTRESSGEFWILLLQSCTLFLNVEFNSLKETLSLNIIQAEIMFVIPM